MRKIQVNFKKIMKNFWQNIRKIMQILEKLWRILEKFKATARRANCDICQKSDLYVTQMFPIFNQSKCL